MIAFFQDNRKEVRVMKKEKLELFAVKEVTRMLGHPKHPHCFTMKSKGNKRVLLNADTKYVCQTHAPRGGNVGISDFSWRTGLKLIVWMLRY